MNTKLGVLSAIAAYVLWGVLPVYWKLLQQVPAHEILCHRMSWSLLFTIGLILILKRFGSLKKSLTDRKNIKISFLAAVLLAGNWLLYIWAVNAGHVIEASLGYFINPLISVLFGVIFLKESMRRAQVGALLIAAIGVIYLTVYYGQFPWIALSLAGSFGLYGLLHKKSSIPALEGLCLETMALFLPATVLLVFMEASGSASFGHIGIVGSLLLFGTGMITSLPLLFFGYAAQNISLTHLGLLQYIAPTINLLLGIFIYHEPFPASRMVGFILIWSALVIYMAESVLISRRRKQLISAA